MSPHDMNALARAELGRIPKGARGSALSMYRMIYYDYRLNSLGKRPQIASTSTSAAAHAAALQSVRQWHPDFESPLNECQ